MIVSQNGRVCLQQLCFFRHESKPFNLGVNQVKGRSFYSKSHPIQQCFSDRFSFQSFPPVIVKKLLWTPLQIFCLGSRKTSSKNHLKGDVRQSLSFSSSLASLPVCSLNLESLKITLSYPNTFPAIPYLTSNCTIFAATASLRFGSK